MYDINCQYCVHHAERIGKSSHLHGLDGISIKYAIGLFHIHAHKPICYTQFSPLFIKGAGNVAGEIIETLWAQLNQIATSCRTASHVYRAELLDRHWNYGNEKKNQKCGKLWA